VDAIPDCERFVDADPAGPCAAYPMFDSWSDTAVADGVVFAGDAAGFSDPTIGQGLSVALRDARMVRDVLLGGDDWSMGAFTPYVEERAERMRRLRFIVQVFTDAHIPLGVDRLSERRRRKNLMMRDSDLFMLVAAMTCGPELAPEPCFGDDVREKLLNPV
jgi:2-polyprenyl-6-methoxyphenol hydroxylase-like FAD-dependent oxidoreductase